MSHWYTKPAKGKQWICLNYQQCGSGPRATKPTTKKCPKCGSQWHERQGWYGVFHWTGDGRYPVDSAVELFTRESQAESYVQKSNDDTLVIRFVT